MPFFFGAVDGATLGATGGAVSGAAAGNGFFFGLSGNGLCLAGDSGNGFFEGLLCDGRGGSGAAVGTRMHASFEERLYSLYIVRAR